MLLWYVCDLFLSFSRLIDANASRSGAAESFLLELLELLEGSRRSGEAECPIVTRLIGCLVCSDSISGHEQRCLPSLTPAAAPLRRYAPTRFPCFRSNRVVLVELVLAGASCVAWTGEGS
jgi:hypothetical protein